nr:MAG TPA: Small Terminase [Caudoviricetes sp.]
MKYNDIKQKYNITQAELRSIVYKYKLTRTKSKAQMGNKNALGNKGGTGAEIGNKNAVTTGEYENIYKDVLDEDELDLYENYQVDDVEQLLMEEYKILTIREKRMLKRIKKLNEQKDMTIDFIRKKNSKSETETITEAEPTINLIQRIEEGLTRVQEAKRKCIESLNKINDGEDKTLNLNVVATNPLLESINRQLGGGANE